MVMMETWVEEKWLNRIRDKLPKGYRWGAQWASKEGRRERAREGMVVGVRKELMRKESKINVEKEGIVVGEIGQGKDKWRIIGVYVNKGIETMARNVEGWIKRKEKERKILIGGILMQG